MRSNLPKVVHPLGGWPLLAHSLKAVVEAGCRRVVIVVGHGAEEVQKALAPWLPPEVEVSWALQAQQLGTGHAARMAEPLLPDFEGDLFILPGDVPLIRPETLRDLLQIHRHERAGVTVMSTVLPDGAHYGRIVRDEGGIFQRIVEARDATSQEKAIREINTGVFVVAAPAAFDRLRGLSQSNAQGEYYLTDLVALARAAGDRVMAWVSADTDALQGINDRVELAAAEARLRSRINIGWMKAGVTLVDPGNIFISPESVLGTDIVVHPMAVLHGACRVSTRCEIGPGAVLEGAHLGEGVVVGSHAVVRGSVPGGTIIPPLSLWSSSG